MLILQHSHPLSVPPQDPNNNLRALTEENALLKAHLADLEKRHATELAKAKAESERQRINHERYASLTS